MCRLAVSLHSLVYSPVCPSELCLILEQSTVSTAPTEVPTEHNYGHSSPRNNYNIRPWPTLPLSASLPLCSRETERNGVRRRADIIVRTVLCGECSANACSINLLVFQHTCHTAVKNHVVVFWIMTPSRLAATG